MAYTNIALKEKIMEMYPEIGAQHFSVGLVFNEDKNAYIVTLSSERGTLTTHLEKQDADDCMNNIKCVYLGIQIGQFVKNFPERWEFDRKTA
ncbi:MAG: hypothetical protein A2078_05030 [Nitrospirae bacterium GWC2_57_9]|nr:MAG: hypothetical protein A2078_05030 [Nitrospirae bacterium GWC2_57_9]